MRENRICKREDYLLCYEQGFKFHTTSFVVYVLESPNGVPRYGITVSRKIGNAVKRNRIKRVLREFFRLNLMNMPDMQFVVVAKKNAVKIDLSKAEAELLQVFRHLKQRKFD